MISAERFARERGSYWQERLPRMEGFVRAMNLSVGRFSPPIAPAVDPERRAFVAELGFELFRARAAEPQREPDLDAAVNVVRALIARVSSLDPSDVARPSVMETNEALLLAESLWEFVEEREAQSFSVNPDIPGCGIIDRAAADLLISRASWWPDHVEAELWLYEVKTVDRPFRGPDIRQLLVYAALMAAAERPAAVIGLVNPRLGTYFEWGLDELVTDISGLRADELLQQLIFDVSAGEISP